MIASRICRVFDKSARTFRFLSPKCEPLIPKCKFSISKSVLPDPPKRPLTAYLIFCRENRASVLKDNPSLSTPQMAKVLAEKWNNLNPNLKKEYEDIARKGLISYGIAHKVYYENLTAEQKLLLSQMKEDRRSSLKKLRLKRALKESGLPIPPSSSYTIYLKTKAKDRESMNLAEFSKEVAEVWRKMTDEEKMPYIKKAELMKEEYEVNMKNWQKKMMKDGQEELIKGFVELKVKKKNTSSKDDKTKLKGMKIK